MGVDQEFVAPEPSEEPEGFEVLMSSSGEIRFPSGMPDKDSAAAFLAGAVARQHELLDRFAASLLSHDDEDRRTQTGHDLGNAITSLQIAAAMFSTLVPTKAGFELMSEGDDQSPFADEHGAYDLAPVGELPASVPLHIELSRGDYDVRVRDAQVYSTGFLLTVDVRFRRSDERVARWLDWADYRLSGRWGSSLTDDARDAVDYPAGWRTLPPQPGMTRGERTFWIDTSSGLHDFAFRLLDPMSDSLTPWRFSIDAVTLAAAEPLS
ncbi:hypothetical protein CLV49_0121 [Labedella gwakjiensis]|uniref:Uncharacterized protein n=1 Tax=Labedella gwakjiensis TaxID=390269 RepID=A0A2P8GRC4_9MICO|nr:hypothetical protein CLV49_0121 [Labedella gwakjiensis]